MLRLLWEHPPAPPCPPGSSETAVAGLPHRGSGEASTQPRLCHLSNGPATCPSPNLAGRPSCHRAPVAAVRGWGMGGTGTAQGEVARPWERQPSDCGVSPGLS